MNNIKRVFEDWKFAMGLVALAVAFVALFLSVYLITKTYSISETNNVFSNTITVIGKGEAVAIPDVATFNFSIIETSESVASAQSVATEKNNEVIDYLKEQGIEDRDLKTINYNVYPKYEWVQEICAYEFCPPSGNQSLVGYEVNQSVLVKIRDTEKAGEILSGIGSLGVSNVSGLSFEIDDEESLEEMARSEAIQNAKKKAKVLAKELGIDLESIVSFSEEQSGGYYPEYRTFGVADGLGEAFSSPKIETGENTVTKIVYITYEVKD